MNMCEHQQELRSNRYELIKNCGKKDHDYCCWDTIDDEEYEWKTYDGGCGIGHRIIIEFGCGCKAYLYDE